MILGIFYARFFPQKGPKVVAQSPPGCIVATEPIATASIIRQPLFDFDVVRSFVIPRKPFCNRLVAVNDPDDRCAVIGYPVLIRDDRRYKRNEFMFNFCVVVPTDESDHSPYERVVRRLAETFTEMEKQSGYLSAQDNWYGDHTDGQTWDGPDSEIEKHHGTVGAASEAVGRGSTMATKGKLGLNETGGCRPIESLLEIIREDLNNYGECMIPVDDANTINMKLFPRLDPPAEVQGWHVPVAKVKFNDITDPTWDLTMQRVASHIDGVSDVRRIAWQADVSLELAKTALRHLLLHDAVLLLDMFFFSACYAPRPGVHEFIANVDGIVDECAAYVALHPSHNSSISSTATTTPRGRSASGPHGPGTNITGLMPGRPGSSRGVDGSLHNDSSDGTLSTPMRRGTNSLASELSPHRGNNGSPRPGNSSANDGNTPHRSDSTPNKSAQPLTYNAATFNFRLIKLMTSLCHGKSVMEWLRAHQESGFDVLRHVDVRRFVQFGVVKGCLYRVHRYPVSRQYLLSIATGQVRVPAGPHPAAVPVYPADTAAATQYTQSFSTASSSFTDYDADGGADDEAEARGYYGAGSSGVWQQRLQRYLDGRHPMDQVVTEQNMTEHEVMRRLKDLGLPDGDLRVLHR